MKDPASRDFAPVQAAIRNPRMHLAVLLVELRLLHCLSLRVSRVAQGLHLVCIDEADI